MNKIIIILTILLSTTAVFGQAFTETAVGDSTSLVTNYRRDTAIANVRAEMFLNSVIVAGEGSYYHSAGADFSVPNGNKDAQVYIQQAADLAVSRGVSLSTFVANGGQFRIAEGTGNLEIWDIGFLIEKTHHAR
jgi:hypothetical protein